MRPRPDGVVLSELGRAPPWGRPLRPGVAMAALILPSLSAPAIAGRQQEPCAEAYGEVVEAYRRGETASSIETLLTWPEKELAEAADRRRDCTVESRRAAAVMLHTETALRLAGRADRRGSVGLHLRMSHQILERSTLHGRSPALSRAFPRQWFLAVGLFHLRSLDLRSARRWFERGLDSWPADPPLMVGLGATFEVAAWRQRPVVQPNQEHPPPDERRTRGHAQERARYRWRLSEAAGLYRRALAARPALDEARLRLGRVEMHMGRTEDGLAQLAVLLRESREPDIRYLAGLFSGRAHERRGALATAVEHYRAASDELEGQVALFALGHGLFVLGRDREAEPVIRRGLRSGTNAGPDPWRLYPESRLAQLQSLLSRLRAEARR